MTARRVSSVDQLRGLVVVLMALDHVRGFVTDYRVDPTDLARATPGLLLTRWVTHFCAPAFFLLAGVGAALARCAGRTRREVAGFLVVRGVFLGVLENTVVMFGAYFRVDYPHGPGLLA